jgi:hypothetical protein
LASIRRESNLRRHIAIESTLLEIMECSYWPT